MRKLLYSILVLAGVCVFGNQTAFAFDADLISQNPDELILFDENGNLDVITAAVIVLVDTSWFNCRWEEVCVEYENLVERNPRCKRYETKKVCAQSS